MLRLPALLAGTLLLVAGCAGQAAVREFPVVGAPGIGDDYFPGDGNGGYDVQRYDLDIGYDPATDELTGTALVTADITGAPLRGFSLDLVGLDVASVRVDGTEVTTTRDGDELLVDPGQVVVDGRFTVQVEYSGVPEPVRDGPGVSGVVPTDDGVLVVGQPDVAATWFPVNDHPRDAAAVQLSVTVPEDLVAVSNGTLVAEGEPVDGERTWVWRSDEPMAPYLITLAVGDYDLTEREVDGITYRDAVATGLTDRRADNARAALDRQPEVVDFLAGMFGSPYPFTECGGIVTDSSLGFALETQTRPIYARDFFGTASAAELVVVHELAHQWTGDDLRLDRWSDIWLNEGFATYAEWAWTEAEGGETVADQLAAVTDLSADDEFWQQAIGDPGPATDELFSTAVYVRGAATLAALREGIGDDAFDELLSRWTTDRAGQAVTTAEFTELAAEVAGTDLSGFFADWLGAGKPT
ncbi:M1 family metallopeptidase [Klenkia sp. PcliD-1-E]|uniref:M1 family metallopeptidase n=1 Tax=Klenkia sp. PcliD-1-E TaxID=2954492 RepID=UPI00209823AF|nr:M1 family metallopeptidase [Klenkia sp. PcliD-1-E]MCO7219641.1 M1 family metallopeptidase [Klenkia sp. PcliD-1-E]